MTVARITPSTAYHRPQGIEGAAFRLGMALVAWAHARARRSDEELTRSRRRARTADRALADHEAALARAAQTRMV